MQTDGRKIARDLISHRNLWEAIWSELDDVNENPIKLRDLERYSSGIICIGIKKSKKENFERLAETWNPLAIQYLQMRHKQNDELVVELCFGQLEQNYLT